MLSTFDMWLVVANAFSRRVFDNHSTKTYPIQAVATMNEIVLTDEQYSVPLDSSITRLLDMPELIGH